MAQRYLIASADIALRDWGEELSVVFAPSSNSTHLVTAAAAKLLQFAAESPDGVSADVVGLPAEWLDGLVAAGLLRRYE